VPDKPENEENKMIYLFKDRDATQAEVGGKGYSLISNSRFLLKRPNISVSWDLPFVKL